MAGLPTKDIFHARIAPMEPVPVPPPGHRPPPGHPLIDPAFACQLKWDGVRMIAFLAPGRVRLQNRRLRDRTDVYPEFAGLDRLVAAREAIMDGEVVVLRDGRPSFPRVLERELVAGPPAAIRAAATRPAAFAAFDLLYLDGEDLTGRPWWARQELLRARVRADDGAILHPTGTYTDGLALWAEVEGQGLEGVVAKRRTSPYLPGRRSTHWVKVKVRRRLDCVLGGYTLSGGRVAALLAGLYRDAVGGPPALVHIGRVGSGLDEPLRDALAARLPALARREPPFVNPPRLPVTVRWLEPLLTMTVAFAEWSEGLVLRAPSLLGFSEADPVACRF